MTPHKIAGSKETFNTLKQELKTCSESFRNYAYQILLTRGLRNPTCSWDDKNHKCTTIPWVGGHVL